MSGVEFLGVTLPNRSVLASGILGVTAASLRRIHREGAGLVTTKSVGPAPRRGHHGPVVLDWGEGLVNAVGLSNPGAAAFAARFGTEPIDFPLSISIFGERESDFPAILEQIESLGHRFIELNLSCPNVQDEFGTPFAFSPELTARIVRTAKERQSLPVIAKLSPNVPDIAGVARAAEAAGADALCLSNTAGPGMVIDIHTGYPVLSNRTGGVSGDAVLPITVSTVYKVYGKVSIPIIGVGGISTPEGALQVMMAGARLFGLGTGVYTKGIAVFREVTEGVRKFAEENNLYEEQIVGMAHRQNESDCFSFSASSASRKPVYLSGGASGQVIPQPQGFYKTRPAFVVKPVARALTGPDLAVKTILFDRNGLEVWPHPGQFYMLWYPGADQKPFSVSYVSDRLLGFSFAARGPFTETLFSLEGGDPVGILGPLGNGFSTDRDNYLLVGGGIGCAPLVHTAITLLGMGRKVSFFAGGKNLNTITWVQGLFELEGEGRAAGLWSGLDVRYCTEDGSAALTGLLTDHMDEVMDAVNPSFVLLCGPEPFILRSMQICEARGVDGEAGIERVMKCGVGICGSCSMDDRGERVCVEGPVFDFRKLREISEFGRYRRDESGQVTGMD
jgi:dihydroorotate dehydrogenase (NAD+) catalytic subunit